MLIRTGLYILFCLIAGGAIAAGYVAFISLLGVFEKLSEKYKTNKSSRLVETAIITGVTLGNLFILLQPMLISSPLFLSFFTLFGGIFVGCLAGALAETLNVFPVISRRLGIRTLFPYVIYACAIGKCIGSFIQLTFLK